MSTLGVVTRLFRLSEASWAVLGAFALCASGLLSWTAGAGAVAKGLDVYLFLAGMMIASELARKEGLFDYLAALAARHAAGSATRLFTLVFVVGTVVTVFMSNDATAVVLTPAVLAVARAVKAERPLPYLFICAFVANAASFVLPISNPANLVIFQDQMPTLWEWLRRFTLPSIAAIGATYAMLRLTQRASLRQAIARDVAVPALTRAGKATGYGIVLMAIAMLAASALGVQLGWPTFAAGIVMFAAICALKRAMLWQHLGEISWGILPLVAGLFVLVEGLQRTGMLDALSLTLQDSAAQAPAATVWATGVAVALAGNVINNLPAGLIAGTAVAAAQAPRHVMDAVLIGIDLGPNLSVTGSLATILWLTALRREGQQIGAWAFLKLGTVVMVPALLLSLAATFATR